MEKRMRFHHLSMDVNNYDECVNFYKALGMKDYCGWTWKEDGSDYNKGCRNCFLSLNGETIMEIHEVHEANRPQGIICHMCFHFDTDEELEKMYQKALAAGATTFMEPFTMDLMCEPKPVPGAKVSHVFGPAGEQIELLCWHGYDPKE